MKIEKISVPLGTSDELMIDRSGFQRDFLQKLLAEPNIKGKVLDIGCGGNIPQPLASVPEHVRELDGVDLDPAVMDHPHLSRRWHSPFETADIPRSNYDLAYAYNVVEHIPDATAFFQTLRTVLKPGGVFWTLTPHGRHPFCKLARGIELLGGKKLAREKMGNINDYSSYYRLNSARQVCKAIEGVGFISAEFYYYPCMQWDSYFPRALRCAPHLYHRMLGNKFQPFMLVLAYRLQLGSA